MPSRLLTARDIVIGHPSSEEQMLTFASARAFTRGRQVQDHPATLIAYVNLGRWIADCPHCGSGIALHPDWTVTPCLGDGCHRVFRSIVWPNQREDIEAALVDRPLKNQHWGYLRGTTRDVRVPAETIEDLQRDEAERRDEFSHLRVHP